MNKFLNIRYKYLSVDIMASEISDLEQLVEQAKKDIDTSNLDDYVYGILSELKDNVINNISNIKIASDLVTSLICNNNIFLRAGRLNDLRSTLTLLTESESLEGSDSRGIDTYLNFLDEIQNFNKIFNDSRYDDEWKESFYREQREYFYVYINYLDHDDFITNIVAKKYLALTELNLGNTDVALELFNECISEINDYFNFEYLNNKITESKILVEDEEMYHALRLAGDIEFNASRLEVDDYEAEMCRLEGAINYWNDSLKSCPSYLNNTDTQLKLLDTCTLYGLELINTNISDRNLVSPIYSLAENLAEAIKNNEPTRDIEATHILYRFETFELKYNRFKRKMVSD